MKQDQEMVRGTNGVFGIEITNPDGTPFMIIDGQKVVFALKRERTDVNRLVVKTTVNQVEPGVYYLELFPEETLKLEPGMYYYDVSIQWGASGFFNVIEASEFLLKPNISELGDGA